MQAEDILHFWFEELSSAQHFAQEDAIDAMIRVRFGPTWQAAARCELWGWRATPQGRLAEIVVLDQFSRNIHRGTPQAFAQDAQALVLAQELVAGGHDVALPPAQREALILVAALELDIAEAASITGVPEGTVKARVSRARAALARDFDTQR